MGEGNNRGVRRQSSHPFWVSGTSGRAPQGPSVLDGKMPYLIGLFAESGEKMFAEGVLRSVRVWS